MNRFRRFMYGRYGADELYSFLFRLYLILFLINIFFESSIMSYIEICLIIYMFYRVFSKKIYKRRDENVKFLKLKKKIMKPFVDVRKNVKDRDHIYRKCRKCKKILKLPLPYNRGFKVIKCPKCGNKKRILVLRKQEIEIIKNKKN